MSGQPAGDKIPLLNHRFLHVNDAERNPLPRSGHRIVYCCGNIYVIGGYVQYSDNLQVIGEIWQFNLLTTKWRKLCISDLPFSLAASHSVCQINQHIVIHGGTGTTFGQSIDNTLLLVDLKKETCYQLPNQAEDGNAHNLPISTYGHTTTFVNLDNDPLIYKVGGTMSGSFTMNIYCYSLRRQTWRCVYNDRRDWSASAPMPRYRHDTCIYDENLVIIGGCDLHDSEPLDQVDVFDLRSNAWEKWILTGSLPPPLRYQSSVQVGKMVYIFGGLSEFDEYINNNIYCLDLHAKQYTLVGMQFPSAYFHDVCFNPDQNCIYSFGGTYRVSPKERSNALDSFQVVNRLTSLSELAWNQVVQLVDGKAFGIRAVRQLITDRVPRVWTIGRKYSFDWLEAEHTLGQTLQDLIRGSRGLFSPSADKLQMPILLAVCYASLFTVATVSYLATRCNSQSEEKATETGTSRLLSWANNPDDEEHGLMMHVKALYSIFQGSIDEDVQPNAPAHPSPRQAVGVLAADRGWACLTLSAEGLVDELFLVWLFYLLNVPDKFIHRLPNGEVFSRKVQRLHNRWSWPLFA